MACDEPPRSVQLFFELPSSPHCTVVYFRGHNGLGPLIQQTFDAFKNPMSKIVLGHNLNTSLVKGSLAMMMRRKAVKFV
jgi:hypothetical protein